MRQLRDGKVEDFPPQDELRCVMVEHALQADQVELLKKREIVLE